MAAELGTLPNEFLPHTQERCCHNYKFAIKKKIENTHLRYSSFVQCLSPCAIASHACGPSLAVQKSVRG